ncbi:MAG: zinc ribbon domain-containing protein [Candidatus Lokiarchaeota archaeon]|nr:zinc ribbon domain-containing protein [Candidatus Lokiarchaeota archaeon]
MSEYPNEFSDLSDTQKMGRSMRFFGFSRIIILLSSFIIISIGTSIAMKGVDMEQDFEVVTEIVEIALLEFMGQLWVMIYLYAFEALVIAGLGYFVYNVYSVHQIHREDENITRVFYLLLTGFITSVAQFALSIFSGTSILLIWIVLLLNFVVSGLAIAAYFFLQRWGTVYEQQMGVSLPLLSSRFRRLMIGEFLVLLGIIFNFSSLIISDPTTMGAIGGYLGVFTIFGEILVAINLIKAGKILELNTLPQTQLFPSRELDQSSEYPEYPEYKPPQRLFPDKAYFCPSCGAKLESESQDFCMRCGKPIPHPKD